MVCDQHPVQGACGDYLIGYDATFDEYGLWIHDGPSGFASSSLQIEHCPFCGIELPSSRREQWFDQLDAQGVEPEDAPDALKGYGWWLV
jgi:hypothetical protein